MQYAPGDLHAQAPAQAYTTSAGGLHQLGGGKCGCPQHAHILGHSCARRSHCRGSDIEWHVGSQSMHGSSAVDWDTHTPETQLHPGLHSESVQAACATEASPAQSVHTQTAAPFGAIWHVNPGEQAPSFAHPGATSSAQSVHTQTGIPCGESWQVNPGSWQGSEHCGASASAMQSVQTHTGIPFGDSTQLTRTLR